MNRAHKIALDPNDRQATFFAKSCGVARLAYNWGLSEWKQQYSAGGRPSEWELQRYFNSIKDEKFPFVREVSQRASEAALINLGSAFKAFFAGHSEYPSFKKKGHHDAFDVRSRSFIIEERRIRIAKIGWIRMRESLRFAGKPLHVTISRTAGRWFASISVEVPDKQTPKREGPAVGIDWGCTNLATLSTGEKIEGPKPHKELIARLRRLNQSLHRKVKGSRNRAKAKFRLAKLHARIANIRKDFLHKFTTDIARRFSLVGIEDLNVSGMTKNHRLARSILDQSPYEMRRQLEYKCPTHGGKVVAADRFFPSSRLCRACGEKNAELRLSQRTWTCAGCGTIHDRDDNASQNLKQNAVGFTVSACGVLSAGVGTCNTKLKTMNQEPNSIDSDGIGG